MKENLSAVVAALAPAVVTTVTSTFPFGAAGVVAVMEVFDFTTKEADTVPKSTLETPEKPVPVMIITVPPVVGPESGLRPVTVGWEGRKVNLSSAPVALLPPVVVTVTSTSPGADSGARAVIEEPECTVKDDAGTVPKSTAVVPVRFSPEMVTRVPPVDGPEAGLMPVMVGGGTMKVKSATELVGLDPPGVVTMTSTVPAASAAVTAEMDVAESTVNFDAVDVPNRTEVAPVKFDPVRVTVVPPVVGPEPGLMALTMGGGGLVATKVNLSLFLWMLEPPGPVTQTSIFPLASGGEIAVIEAAELTVKDCAGSVPK